MRAPKMAAHRRRAGRVHHGFARGTAHTACQVIFIECRPAAHSNLRQESTHAAHR